MSVDACVYVRVYGSACGCIRICIRIYEWWCMYVYGYPYVGACVCMQICTCINNVACVCMYMNVFVCVY